MKRDTFNSLLSLIIVVLTGATLRAAPIKAMHSQNNQVRQAYALLERVLPHHESSFKLYLIQGKTTNDSFDVAASNGIVTVKGTTIISITRGIYFYLRHAVNGQITWEGEHLSLPGKLPDMVETAISSPYEFRLYYNVCAYGYTTAFWDWKRWEREIDWMALHGVNMPIAMLGQETVWEKVWRELGLTEKDMESYFTGPAFLPWNRMGNIDAYAGPLPKDYLARSEELQRKILRRMRELGMHPVVPGFSGYVPEAVKRIFPDAEVIAMKPWAGFPANDGTYMLSPTSKYFTEVGKKFIQEYEKVYGPSHFYLADAFNEMTVPVSDSGRYRELSEFGKAIYKSIRAGDPHGVWVMQGWLFNSDSKFWDEASVKVFLRDVPDDSMIIIDLSNESFHGWKKLDGFFGKEWIYSVIHNFGGHNQLFGNLPYYANDPIEMLSDSSHGRLVGFGISPEGTENNEAVYELLTDMGWQRSRIDLQGWIRNYCLSRYGGYPTDMERAWSFLLRSVYSSGMGAPLYLYQRRPELVHFESGLASADFDSATSLFLACSDSLKTSELYRDDMIEIASQFAGNAADSLLNVAITCHFNGDFSVRDTAFALAFDIMKKIDRLLSAHPLYNLDRWILFARKWGRSRSEKDYYEMNAKLQVTTWGGPYLSEYAAKVWSGLIDGYYLKRWELLADSLKYGRSFDVHSFENRWIDSPERKVGFNPPDDPIGYAKNLVSASKEAVAHCSPVK